MLAEQVVDFVRQIEFEVTQPDNLSGLPLGDGSWLHEERHGLPFDWLNTRLPRSHDAMKDTLLPIAKLKRLSSFPIAAAINYAVSVMDDGCQYLNLGVWHGFSLFAGSLGNPSKVCFGIDNESEGGVVLALPLPTETENTIYWNVDYREFFKWNLFSRFGTRCSIGVYFLDADHGYKSQLEALELVLPFLAQDCLILVDDTNSPAPRAATEEFLRQHPEFKLMHDARTCANCHPTWWNGVMFLGRS